ncbi:homocysteine S-methyltransferase family protein [uncultured Faecalibaculum sp.]|uniref:homocysteine S-methyltransferase family protein n=1 Tax=uncultured Faecalibaculum sp. TaxID=1729681 RepID=UPI0025FA7472|nr:homocysteine S-methyltransferase family protein [uncultured Faecalibaculum sp.]
MSRMTESGRETGPGAEKRPETRSVLPTLFDGAMGTWYARVSQEPSNQVELANVTDPVRIQEIHRGYLEAGAQALLTNTFALPQMDPLTAGEILPAAVRNARMAMDQTGVQVPLYAGLGPAESGCEPDWSALIRGFLEAGVNRFLFETQPELGSLLPVFALIRGMDPGAQIGVSFAVEADGLTKAGLAAQMLLDEAAEHADFLGLNCLQGPAGMVKLVSSLHWKKPLVIRPNAGSAAVVGNRMSFTASPEYFARTLLPLADRGVSLGGCCGTSPAHIAALARRLAERPVPAESDTVSGSSETVAGKREDNAFMALFEKGKPVLVEADPPANDDVMPWLAAVKRLRQAGADVITISDNPVGRPKADSCMLAALAAREEDILVLPHIACRDKNRNAIRSLITGLSVFGVHQCLVVTGDPVCEEDRSEVRQVYNFNSRRLAGYIQVLNETVLTHPVCVAGALNVNAPNFDVQLRLAKEKIANGVQALLTQPVLSARGLENLKRAHHELDCRILAGIFPVISERNALYLQNEVTGIELDDRIPGLYAARSRQEAEDLAVRICRDVIREAAPYCDGWYIMMPFRRTELVSRIMAVIREQEEVR